MNIKIISLGGKMPNWVLDGCDNYEKRLTGTGINLKWINLPIAKRIKNYSINDCLKQESKKIKEKLSQKDFIVLLDIKSKLISTEDLAFKMQIWQQSEPDIALIIGGPNGVSNDIKSLANDKISFSKMTFPHPLVRIILTEQIYRSWSINNGHPYHK